MRIIIFCNEAHKRENKNVFQEFHLPTETLKKVNIFKLLFLKKEYFEMDNKNTSVHKLLLSQTLLTIWRRA